MTEKPKSIMDRLAQNPNLVCLIQDPADCKLVLAAAAMITESPESTGAGLLVGAGKSYKTHYVIGMIWSGFSLPDENGYQVLCLPKTLFTEENLADFVAGLIAANQGRTRNNAVKFWTDNAIRKPR